MLAQIQGGGFVFYDVYCKLCQENGEKPFSLPIKLGMKSNSAVAQWKNGSIPRKQMLEKIADYFGVTVGYLLDGGEEKSPPPDNGDVLLDDSILFEAYKSAPENVQAAIRQLLGLK